MAAPRMSVTPPRIPDDDDDDDGDDDDRDDDDSRAFVDSSDDASDAGADSKTRVNGGRAVLLLTRTPSYIDAVLDAADGAQQATSGGAQQVKSMGAEPLIDETDA
jgi:hypothetical protein